MRPNAIHRRIAKAGLTPPRQTANAPTLQELTDAFKAALNSKPQTAIAPNLLDMHTEEEINALYKQWQQDHPEAWPKQVANRQEKIKTLKGKIRIRDQALEMESDQAKNYRKSLEFATPYSTKETPKTLDFSHILELEGGMLLVIPPESPPRPRSGTAFGGLPEACPQSEVCGGLELFNLAHSFLQFAAMTVRSSAADTAMGRNTKRKLTLTTAEDHARRAKGTKKS